MYRVCHMLCQDMELSKKDLAAVLEAVPEELSLSPNAFGLDPGDPSLLLESRVTTLHGLEEGRLVQRLE